MSLRQYIKSSMLSTLRPFSRIEHHFPSWECGFDSLVIRLKGLRTPEWQNSFPDMESYFALMPGKREPSSAYRIFMA